MRKELSIIIINFNTADLLKACLASLFKAIRNAKFERIVEIIVVDNASTDTSRTILSQFSSRISAIYNKSNIGFAAANNQGIRASSGDFLLLLNSDTKVEKDTLVNLLKVIRADRSIGVVGPKLLNSDNTVQPSVGFFPTLTKVFFWMSFLDDIPLIQNLLRPYHINARLFYNQRQFVDWVSGACLLVQKEAIEVAGLLDERIFMYAEEVEWCYRIKKKHYQVLYTPEVNVIHHKGASATKENEAGIIEEFVGLIYFYRKHMSFWRGLLLRFFLMYGALLRIVVFGIIGCQPRKIRLYAKALGMVG